MHTVKPGPAISHLNPVKSIRELCATDLPCIIAVKNERLRLPDVLRHHRSLGVTRFLIVDNGSTDNTCDFLLTQPDVDLWVTSQPYSQANLGADWYDEISRRYGRNRWYLIIDADELLVYPGMDKLPLPALCERLTNSRQLTIRAPMIDMYPAGNIYDQEYRAGSSLIEHSSYFDGDSYRYRKTKSGGLVLTGGPRTRIISGESRPFYHVLEKYPLRFLAERETIINVHIHPAANLRTPPTAALLHFKFLPDFKDKVDDALVTQQHWRGSREYKAYERHLSPLTSPWYRHSKKYESPDTLVQARLIVKTRFN